MSQLVGNNDNQQFRIIEQRVQNRQITFSMWYRREHITQMC
jgi:hypothetical protein